jgi:hypothetical protein
MLAQVSPQQRYLRHAGKSRRFETAAKRAASEEEGLSFMAAE